MYTRLCFRCAVRSFCSRNVSLDGCESVKEITWRSAKYNWHSATYGSCTAPWETSSRSRSCWFLFMSTRHNRKNYSLITTTERRLSDYNCETDSFGQVSRIIKRNLWTRHRSIWSWTIWSFQISMFITRMSNNLVSHQICKSLCIFAVHLFFSFYCMFQGIVPLFK